MYYSINSINNILQYKYVLIVQLQPKIAYSYPQWPGSDYSVGPKSESWTNKNAKANKYR